MAVCMRVYACNCDMNDTVQGWDFVAYVNRTKAKKTHKHTHGIRMFG